MNYTQNRKISQITPSTNNRHISNYNNAATLYVSTFFPIFDKKINNISLLNIGISYQAFLDVGFSIGHYMMAVILAIMDLETESLRQFQMMKKLLKSTVEFKRLFGKKLINYRSHRQIFEMRCFMSWKNCNL